MSVKSIRTELRRAAEEIDAACEKTTAADTEEYLTGIVRLLDYYVDVDDIDPEAHAYPPPGALDTIQSRISEVIEETDDPVTEHLQNARSRILEVIMTLDRRLNEGKSPSH